MKYRIISNIVEFKGIENDWKSLYEKNKENTVFQSFDLNYYSWEHELKCDKRNQLAVTVISKNKGVLAILPFYIDSNKQLRFINDRHFDFCDFIAIESINFSEFYDYFKQEVDFKSMRLINIKRETNIYKAVADLNSINKVVKSISVYSFLNVDKGIFPYNVPHYRSHQKHRINKAFNKHKDKKSQILSVDQHNFPKKDILILIEKMISLGVRKDNFLPNDRLLLIESLYNAGILIINIIKKEDQVISINILLKNSLSEFIFWIDLFDDIQMINIANYINFIRVISLADSVEINFGRGRYFYKVSNFSPKFHTLYGIYIFSNRFKRLRFIIFEEFKGLLRLVYKKLKK